MKLCNGNTWTNTLTIIYLENVVKTGFIRCFIVTAESLIWPVVFLFFFSWWLAEEYYLFAEPNVWTDFCHIIYFLLYFLEKTRLLLKNMFCFLVVLYQ